MNQCWEISVNPIEIHVEEININIFAIVSNGLNIEIDILDLRNKL